MPLMINPVPFDCDKCYYKGDIVTHNGEVYVAPDTIPPGPFDRSKWSIMWDYHHLIEKINELQYQLWMQKSRVLFERSENYRLLASLSDHDSNFLQYEELTKKSRKFLTASNNIRMIAKKRYGGSI